MERDKKQTYHIQWALEIYFKINVDLLINICYIVNNERGIT